MNASYASPQARYWGFSEGVLRENNYLNVSWDWVYVPVATGNYSQIRAGMVYKKKA